MIHFLEAGGRRLEYQWIGPRPEDAPTLVFLHEGAWIAGHVARLSRRERVLAEMARFIRATV